MGRANIRRLELSQAKDQDFVTSVAAMKRAAAMARKVAVQTDTAIIFIRMKKLLGYLLLNCNVKTDRPINEYSGTIPYSPTEPIQKYRA